MECARVGERPRSKEEKSRATGWGRQLSLSLSASLARTRVSSSLRPSHHHRLHALSRVRRLLQRSLGRFQRREQHGGRSERKAPQKHTGCSRQTEWALVSLGHFLCHLNCPSFHPFPRRHTLDAPCTIHTMLLFYSFSLSLSR